jgi:predicted glutamine amidotransferase
MCRLFGLMSQSDVDVQYWMMDAVRPFVGWSEVHGHGWGIGWYENGAARVAKEPISALGSQKFNETATDAKSHVFVCHLRKATRGEQTYCNSQPYNSGNWVFAHNGTVDREYLITRLTNDRRTIEGETDSEVYFHWLLHNLENGGVEGLRFGIDEVKKREFTALNFLLSDGHTLYAYWEQSTSAKMPYADYYQLYYSELPEQGGAVAVCSERLNDDKWLRIPHGSLLIVSEQLKTQVISFL